MAAPLKGEKVKRWKDGCAFKRWKGEKVKRWLRL